MEVLNAGLELDRFFRDVACARERVLMLDYDGTLAPFHKRPERARPYPRVAEVLRKMARRCSTRVIVVSGRRLCDLRGPLTWIHHEEAWGAHGWQRLTVSGARVDYVPTRAARHQLALAETPARRLVIHGARIERKVASVAVHWRGMRACVVESIRHELIDAWGGIKRDELHLVEFDGGIELRARGRGKGDAVKEVIGACSPAAACAYLGDDLTDEDAFAAIKTYGLAVLVRPELRHTCADLWLAPPLELVAFLERWCASAVKH